MLVHRVLRGLLVTAIALGPVAVAQDGSADGHETSAQSCRAVPHAAAAAPLVHTFALGEIDVLLDLPASHELAGSDGLWYVFGYLDDAPLVPDVRVYFAAAASTDEAISTLFPGSTAVAVARCFVDELLVVTTPVRLADGTVSSVERYVLPVEGGIIVAERYEGFDWRFFDLVGQSLRTYRVAE